MTGVLDLRILSAGVFGESSSASAAARPANAFALASASVAGTVLAVLLASPATGHGKVYFLSRSSKSNCFKDVGNKISSYHMWYSSCTMHV